MTALLREVLFGCGLVGWTRGATKLVSNPFKLQTKSKENRAHRVLESVGVRSRLIDWRASAEGRVFNLAINKRS